MYPDKYTVIGFIACVAGYFLFKKIIQPLWFKIFGDRFGSLLFYWMCVALVTVFFIVLFFYTISEEMYPSSIFSIAFLTFFLNEIRKSYKDW